MAANYKWRWPSEVRHKFTAGMVIIITMTLLNKKWYLCERSNMCDGPGGGSKPPTSLTCNCVPCTPASRPFFFAFFSIAKYWALYLFRTLPPTSLPCLFSQDPTPYTPHTKLLENFFKQNKAANERWLLKCRKERILKFRIQENNVKYLQDIPWLKI